MDAGAPIFNNQPDITMISQNILEKLNRQVNLEAVSSHLYLQMSAWLLSQELDSTAAFFRGNGLFCFKIADVCITTVCYDGNVWL